jgi:RNA polymerase sigma factor (sigma-70 family)
MARGSSTVAVFTFRGNKRATRSHAKGEGADRTDHQRQLARFDDVVMPHLNDAFGLARWLTGDRAAAEDVVQDACVSAFRGIGNFSNGNARAWTLTIVRRSAYQWLRRYRPAALVFVDDPESVTPMRSSDLQVETPEAARLEEAIAALPVIPRETLVLREVHGLAYREIAEVTGAPIGTVMSRLARARVQLIAAMSTQTHPDAA